MNGYRAPSYSVTGRHAVGHRYPDRRRLRVRREHLSDSSRSIRDPERPHGIRMWLQAAAGRCSRRQGPRSDLGGQFPVGGGGYFRFCRMRGREWGIARINRTEGRPAIFYLHPWEIDPDQPRFNPGLIGRFRHYRNLARQKGACAHSCRIFDSRRCGTAFSRLSAAGAEVPSARAAAVFVVTAPVDHMSQAR